MKAVVFGANGRLGRHIVQGLLERGHQVRAFVHRQNTLEHHLHLEVQPGDVHQSQDVADAVSGMDLVIASLGSIGAPVADVSSSAMTHLIPAMRASNLERIVSVTGSAAYDAGEAEAPHPFLLARQQAMKAGAAALLADGEKHLRILRQSPLDWTVVRAPVMTFSQETEYTLSKDPPPPWTTLSYRAAAMAVIDLASSNHWLRSAPFIRPG